MIEKTTLKNAQEIMFDILVEVDRICQKHKIEYWLDSGTLLGAVRHQGFIPWDDDLDIVMKIEDYDKFCKVAPEELSNGFFLQNVNIEGSFPYDFTKVRSDRGKIVEKHEDGKTVTYNQGIFIDIFPLIAIKDSFLHRKAYISNILLIKLFSYKYLNILSLSRFFVSLSHKFHQGWDKEKSLVVYAGNFPFLPFKIDKESIFPLKKRLFCDKEFPIPHDEDKYLKALYGDSYMQLPPKNQRKTHAAHIEVY